MRKLYLLTAILLLSAAWMVAQDTSQPGSSSSSQTSSDQANSSQSTNAPETTIEGCLSGSSGSYTLTDASGKIYQLQGDASKLSDHVGHEVRIKGSETGASASASTPSGASASASTSTSGNPSSSASPSSASSPSGNASAAIQFNVEKVKKISDTCTSSSMKALPANK